jgi:hypothetical protein
MTEEIDQARAELTRKAVNAAFNLAMMVRCYLGALDRNDDMLRRWVLEQVEQRLPQLADDVITPITTISDLDYFEAHGFPR